MQRLKQADMNGSMSDYKQWFYSNVEEGMDCWVWTPQATGAGGYGICRWIGTNTQMSPHKVAWIMERGAVPEGKLVKHSCWNKKCVKLEHMFLDDPGGVPFTYEQRVANFWTRVVKANGCWGWNGARGAFVGKKGAGYGVMRFQTFNVQAHRFSWEIHNGPIPDGLLVLHTCDNPPCCNPDHLFLGTYLDNARDRDSKGRLNHRTLYGEEIGSSKTTNAQVLSMRELHKSGAERKDIAAQFGVPVSRVNQIVYRYTWRHLL